MSQAAEDRDAATPSCCAPAQPANDVRRSAPAQAAARELQQLEADSTTRHLVEQCRIPAGSFTMGDATGDGLTADGELPLHQVSLDAYDIDATPVTNEQFARFISDTGYLTDAERLGASAVFHLLVDAPTADISGPIPGTPWWIGVHGASWRSPNGGGSNIIDVTGTPTFSSDADAGSLAGTAVLSSFADHPVVHVSWNDAAAYCAWAGRRLPTEAEWERASRGGRDGACFPWGDEVIDGSDGIWRANVWQGTFPSYNSASDGWLGTAPVRSYAPNDFGLWQTVGNVWEWCADGYDAHAYEFHEVHNPGGPVISDERVLRGGSYLCHPSYCNRYRNSARSRNSPESTMGNAGFRTVSQPHGASLSVHLVKQ